MIIDLNKDWMNAPVKYGLTLEERQRRLELYQQQARQRKQDAEAAEAALVALVQLLAQRGL
jgi:hypothetical protein